MTIKVGDKLPDAKFMIKTEDGPAELTTKELFEGKTVVLFGVPGAFTPTCHMNHLPGFVEHADTIKAKGVDTIAVIAANDLFVMDAWKTTSKADGITFLSDPAADFIKAIGMGLDAPIFGSTRAQRFALIAKDGVVTFLSVEDAPGELKATGAASILEAL